MQSQSQLNTLFNLFKAESGLIYTLTKETIEGQENVERERERDYTLLLTTFLSRNGGVSK